MKVTVERATMEFADFADRHGLELVVRERSDPGSYRWYASFKNVEIKEGVLLVSAFGDGESIGAAVGQYARKISGQTIVVNAMHTDRRREIRVPRLSIGQDTIDALDESRPVGDRTESETSGAEHGSPPASHTHR